MRVMRPRNASVLAVIAALLGLVFAAYSTYDYAAQLDRQVHAVHCSFIPGAPVSNDADNACKAALFSPYSAIFRATYWGGIPISLFGLGAFAFFVGFALYLRLGDGRLPRSAFTTFAGLTLGPVAVSLVMFTISVTHLHALCKLCVGIYTASIVMAIAAILAMRGQAGEATPGSTAEGSAGGRSLLASLLVSLAALGAFAVAPALVYVALLPDYGPSSCSRTRSARPARPSTSASSTKGRSSGST
jgi:uncharacterized membrane protein